MAEHAMESKLRPAVELYTVAICIAAAVLCMSSPWAVALSPEIGQVAALAYALFGLIRLRQAWEVLRYRRNIRRLPRYELTSRQIPVSRKRLFMGRGFRWTRLHTQRLVEAQDPAVAHYVDQPTNQLPPGPWTRTAPGACTVSALDIGPCHRLGQCLQSVAPFTPGRWLATVAWGRAR